MKWQEYKSGTGEQETTVTAAVVDKDSTGTTVQTIGGPHVLTNGEVVLQRDRPELVDVLSREQWQSTGYSRGSEATPERRETPERSPSKRAASKTTSVPLVPGKDTK